MNRLTTLDINKLTPYAVGFDRVFDDMFKYIEHNTSSTGYPPYNIIKDGEKFQIELALAGVDKKDLEITVAEGVLTVEHKAPGEQDLGNSWDWIHKGIAQRSFKRNFTLSDDIVVQGSRMENGMLYIELERIIPEEKKPKTIAIK
jgi:molecular chaperone IbpA|tara:strand:- start:7327 stop:7761 length:435 start_codon:yes stop_codon:yes gene_type:complete